MSALDKARKAARIEVEGLYGNDANTEWRSCYSTDGTDGPTGIAPVCLDEDHDLDDGSVYACCPEPIIETGSTPVAEYLAALLNSDRGTEGKGTGTTGGEPTPAVDFYQPGQTYRDGDDWAFRCDTITTDPQDGELIALGWRRVRGEWAPYAYTADDWEVYQFHLELDDTGGGR